LAAVPSVTPDGPQLQGVDLRLDSFDLSSTTRVARHIQPKILEEGTLLGEEFWSLLDADDGFLHDDRKALLKSIFNCELSDRRMEGEFFTPPDSTDAYLAKLESLLQEEDDFKQQRKQHFLGDSFDVRQPGAFFPSSWAAPAGASVGGAYKCTWKSCAERLSQQTSMHLLELLEPSKAVFDKTTDDGQRFRIYSLGEVEVRTTQQVDGTEELGAVFTCTTRSTDRSLKRMHDEDWVSEVTEFVERTSPTSTLKQNSSGCTYFAVLSTHSGHIVVVERQGDAQTSWDEDPPGWEHRKTFARVLRTKVVQPQTKVKDLRFFIEMRPEEHKKPLFDLILDATVSSVPC